MFDQGVGEKGGGVDHPFDFVWGNSFIAQHLIHGVQDRRCRIAGGGQDLARQAAALAAVVQHNVGEGAADINAQGVFTHSRSLSQAVWIRAAAAARSASGKAKEMRI